jgi:hypothetical protein
LAWMQQHVSERWWISVHGLDGVGSMEHVITVLGLSDEEETGLVVQQWSAPAWAACIESSWRHRRQCQWRQLGSPRGCAARRDIAWRRQSAALVTAVFTSDIAAWRGEGACSRLPKPRP